MVIAKINNVEVNVPEGTTILDTALSINVKIPALCGHKDLFPTAACGMCIVKIDGRNKTPRACCTKIENGMEIFTHDLEIVEIRKTILELILSNHPQSCQSCIRNGNCELQTLASDLGIRSDEITRYYQELPKDDSTEAAEFDISKCIKCGRCAQVCQNIQNVWALSALHRGINNMIAPAENISLASSPCVKCGQCAIHCPTGAITEKDDVPAAWNALRDNKNFCTVQIAPAVRVAIGDYFGLPANENCTGKLYTAMRMLGFKAVFDTSFSADLTIMEEAAELVERISNNDNHKLPLLTSCCPAWVDFVEKFYPDFCDNLSSAKSPQQMLGAMAKTYFAKIKDIAPSTIIQVSVMPCTAKKYEIRKSDEMFSSGQQDVDICLTTRELARMIKQAGIDFSSLSDGASDSILGEHSGAGLLFGATGGVMEAALRTAYFNITGKNMPNNAVEINVTRGLKEIKKASLSVNGVMLNFVTIHGLANASEILNELRSARKNSEPSPFHFIEVMACRGGCLGGGGQPYDVNDKIRKQRAENLYCGDRTKTKRCSHDNPEIKAIYASFLGSPNSDTAHTFLHTKHYPKQQYLQ